MASACALPDLDSLSEGVRDQPDAAPGGGAPGGGAAGEGPGGSGGSGGSGNLFVNGNFDDGPSRWIPVGDCTVSLSTDRPRSAERCLMAANRRQTWEGPGYTLLNLIEPGRSYAVSVWVRADEGSYPLGITFKHRCPNDPGTGSFLPLGSTLVSTEWTEVTGILDAPECDPLEATVYLDGAPIGATYCIDDTSLELLP